MDMGYPSIHLCLNLFCIYIYTYIYIYTQTYMYMLHKHMFNKDVMCVCVCVSKTSLAWFISRFLLNFVSIFDGNVS
jgi:hypothetical protein